jgi:GT2 family glycosyltransferase
MKSFKISAVIPTYNSIKTVERTIRSLLDQSLKLSEIIVVDNASTDHSSTILNKKFGSKIKLIKLKKNTGVTGGRNEGIKNISPKSNFVLFMDHDMIADSHMTEEMVKGFKQSSEIGIITPKIYYLKPKDVIWSAGTGMNLWTGQVLFRGGKDTGQYDQPTEVQVAPAVLLVKKTVIEKIKRFDPIYFATYEDTDFCFKALSVGFKTYYMPKAVAFHDLPYDQEDAQNRLLNRLYYVGRNRIIFLRRYGYFTSVPLSFGFGLYYLYLSIRQYRIGEFAHYIKGTIDGMTIKV